MCEEFWSANWKFWKEAWQIFCRNNQISINEALPSFDLFLVQHSMKNNCSKCPELNYCKSKESKSHKEYKLHRFIFLPLKKTNQVHKLIISRRPRYGICQGQKHGRNAASIACTETGGPTGSQIPSSTMAAGRRLVSPAKASRIYPTPPCRVEGPLHSTEDSWKLWIPKGKRSQSCCVREGWQWG